ncbi:MAG TPA: hypothetical protein VD905_01540 [Flavobacteriales bacterium]|nr:hypothetical protein [Flavobacteriales bacterium]
MKKGIILLLGILISLNFAFEMRTGPAKSVVKVLQRDWVRADKGYWRGKKENDIVYYRLDADGRVYWSADAKTWSQLASATWMDYDGKWYKVHNNLFFMSDDSGKTWGSVPGAAWRGGDGRWYKFDDHWNVWVEK